MARPKLAYYDKRQIIDMLDVLPDDYTENVLVCLPRFAWWVARAFLSVQAQWGSTYAMAYHLTYYETPDPSEMDVIQASIDEALGGDDMSCDLLAGLNEIADAIREGTETPCGPGCGGSAGAGKGEAEPIDFSDDGENWPDTFDDREQYLTWKCRMANFIVDRLIADLETVKDIGYTEITATILAATLLTPIPLDDVALLLGVIIAYGVEEVLDAAIDDVLTALGVDRAYVVCLLFDALTATTAASTVEGWGGDVLDTVAGYLFSLMITVDGMNQLFETQNLIIAENTCVCDQVGVVCFDWETSGTLEDWFISSTQGSGPFSLDNSQGGLTASEAGAGLSQINYDSEHNVGYVVQAGDLWTLDHEFLGPDVCAINLKAVFEDATEAYVYLNSATGPFLRRTNQLNLSPWAGKTISYFRGRVSDASSGGGTWIWYNSCIVSPPAAAPPEGGPAPEKDPKFDGQFGDVKK